MKEGTRSPLMNTIIRSVAQIYDKLYFLCKPFNAKHLFTPKMNLTTGTNYVGIALSHRYEIILIDNHIKPSSIKCRNTKPCQYPVQHIQSGGFTTNIFHRSSLN